MIVLPYAWYAIKINSFSAINAPEDFHFYSYSELWITCISLPIFALGRRLMRLSRPLVLKTIPHVNDKNQKLTDFERNEKAAKVERHLYDAINFSLSTIVAFYLCLDQDWMPWYLGGKGDLLKNGFVDLPFPKVDRMIPVFGFINLGYRIESLILTLSDTSKKDFQEMFLHDLVTIFLFFGYLFGYMLSIGTMIIIVHDLTDVPLHITKALNSTVYDRFVPFTFILSQLMWIYFRLYCFPMLIRDLVFVEYPEQRAQFNPFVFLNAAFLLTLLAMHFLWFYMFQKINIKMLN